MMVEMLLEPSLVQVERASLHNSWDQNEIGCLSLIGPRGRAATGLSLSELWPERQEMVRDRLSEG